MNDYIFIILKEQQKKFRKHFVLWKYNCNFVIQ